MARRLLLALIVAGACAAAAGATIRVQHGIAGVTIGMSQAKVRSVLGKPAKVIRGSNAFGRYERYRYAGLTLDFQGPGPLSYISTVRRSERTPQGIGVGSTQAQVKHKVRNVKCYANLCTVGNSLAGRIVTTFYLRRGVVRQVSVGRVID